MIDPLALHLNIPVERVYANRFEFSSDDGAYLGFDKAEYTSESMGKAKVIHALIQSYGYKHVVMIGDGQTDAEAKPPAKVFIGYGGIKERPNIKAKADYFVYDFDDLVV